MIGAQKITILSANTSGEVTCDELVLNKRFEL